MRTFYNSDMYLRLQQQATFYSNGKSRHIQEEQNNNIRVCVGRLFYKNKERPSGVTFNMKHQETIPFKTALETVPEDNSDKNLKS